IIWWRNSPASALISNASIWLRGTITSFTVMRSRSTRFSSIFWCLRGKNCSASSTSPRNSSSVIFCLLWSVCTLMPNSPNSPLTIAVATAIVKGLLGLFGIKVQTDQSKQKMTLEELRGLVLDAEQFLPRKHQKMLLNLVDLERITVNDVMIPRNQIEALDINADAGELRHQMITCHHTLLPVYEGKPANIIGVLHVNHAPALLQEAVLDVVQLREVLTEPYFIPSDTPLLKQLQQFQERDR